MFSTGRLSVENTSCVNQSVFELKHLFTHQFYSQAYALNLLSRWDQFLPGTVRGKVEVTNHMSVSLGCILKVCLNRVACVDFTWNKIIFHWFCKIKKVCTIINIRLAFLSFQKLTMSSILRVGSQGLKGHEQSSLAHPERTLCPAVSCVLIWNLKKENPSIFTFICFYCTICILPNSSASARKFMKRLNSIQGWVHEM